MTRAAIYARISKDREGEALGVKRQEQDCRALAGRKGWDVADVYVDDDISAYSGKVRPAYRALMAALKAGEVDAVVAYTNTRLHRSMRELEDFIDVVEARGAAVAIVQGGDYDLTSSAGRMTARILGAVARGESEQTSERIKRKFQEKREKGEWTGGGRQPYGFGKDRVTIVEAEAEIIRDAARRVLAGESTFGVAADLTRRGVPSATGGRWSSIRLKRMLRSGRVAGRMTHRVYDGKHWTEIDLGPAVWPAIITPGQSVRLRAVLTDGRPPARQRHLLSGVLRCTCGHAMVSGGSSGGHEPIYACRRDMGGCGTTIRMKPVEALVVKALMPRLDAAPLMQRNEPEDPDVARIEEARANIIAIGEQKLSPASLPLMLAPWERQIADAEKRLAAKKPTQFRQVVAAFATWWKPDDVTRWLRLTPEQQRVIVQSLIEKIDIAPVGATRKFRPERVTIHWR